MSGGWTGWTDESIEIAKRMWNDNKTATEIGSVIGATRSSIIAKMHRLGLPKNGVTTRPLIRSAIAEREAAEAARVEQARIEAEARQAEIERLQAEAEAARAAEEVRLEEVRQAEAIKARLAETFNAVLSSPQPIEVVRPTNGVRFLDARERMCRYPLWGNRDQVPIHKKYVCGATTVSPTCSWCTEHLVVVADPIRKARYSNSAKA